VPCLALQAELTGQSHWQVEYDTKNLYPEVASICPVISEAHVEQDLIISRALVELYSQELVKKNLLFRGGDRTQ
jgi:hypothetical protein